MQSSPSKNSNVPALANFFSIGLILSIVLFGNTVLGQDSIQQVQTVQGDGIYSLLRRHGLDPVKYYSEFVSLNKETLGADNQLSVGRDYKIPYVVSKAEQKVEIEVVKTTTNPIFGDDYAVLDSLSTRLNNTVYYLISGHGGPDPGAVETYGEKLIAEDEYAYDVTLRLARELMAHGAEVYIVVQDANDGIRDERVLDLDTDEVVYPNKLIPLGQVKRLKQRVDVVNRLFMENTNKYQRLIVTHVDSRSKGTNIDVFFYHHHKSKNGKRLAENIHKTFEKKYKKFQPNRNYSGTFKDRSSLYLVKNTLPAMVYIEIGNIRNKKDQRRILDPDNRQALAKWISEGILIDFETKPN